MKPAVAWFRVLGVRTSSSRIDVQRSEYAGFHIFTHAGERLAIEVRVPDEVPDEDAVQLGLALSRSAAVAIPAGERPHASRHRLTAR